MEQHIKTQLKIVKKVPINHDCYIYTFSWVGQSFSIHFGQYLRVHQFLKNYEFPQGEQIMRKYSPIVCCDGKSDVQILLKIYRPTQKFPHGGKLTPYIESLKQGDIIDVEGPFGRFSYKPGGIAVISGQQRKFKKFFFICGGSGIAPVFQTINEIVSMKEQTIQIILLFANKNQEDIVPRKQIQALIPRITVHYILDYPPPDWKGYSGYVTKQVLSSICQLNDPDTLFLHCGPKPMNKLIMELFAKEYPNSKTYKY